jgi:hypothetical protein
MDRRGFIGRMVAAIGIVPALPAIAAHDGDQEDTVEIYDLFSDEMRELKITTPETLKLARQQGWKKV